MQKNTKRCVFLLGTAKAIQKVLVNICASYFRHVQKYLCSCKYFNVFIVCFNHFLMLITHSFLCQQRQLRNLVFLFYCERERFYYHLQSCVNNLSCISAMLCAFSIVIFITISIIKGPRSKPWTLRVITTSFKLT